ncbi:MAG: hypothetical protein ACJ8OJ_16515 [Povalibacter sp.]|jgi:hypothetical protein
MQASDLPARIDAVRSLGYVHKLRLESQEFIRDVEDEELPPWALSWRRVLGRLVGAFTLLSLALWGTQLLR